MLRELDHSQIQPLPQTEFLHAVIDDLWAEPTVMAIWLGGSFARHAADRDSDVDLRVAVPKEHFDLHTLPGGTGRLAARIAARLEMQFIEQTVLHHLLLDDGSIYDLLVYTTSRGPSSERRLVLGCRDEKFGDLLVAGADPPLTPLTPADAGDVSNLIAEYWIGFSKHRKVLNRGLDLLACQGEQFLRAILFRLYHVQATGADCGARPTIHSMTPAVRNVQHVFGGAALAEIGRPMRTRAELIESAEAIADEVGRVGRILSDRLQFEYPAKAETAARTAWKRV
jgi:predicted nucleotidyltransferase